MVTSNPVSCFPPFAYRLGSISNCRPIQAGGNKTRVTPKETTSRP